MSSLHTWDFYLISIISFCNTYKQLQNFYISYLACPLNQRLPGIVITQSHISVICFIPHNLNSQHQIVYSIKIRSVLRSEIKVTVFFFPHTPLFQLEIFPQNRIQTIASSIYNYPSASHTSGLCRQAFLNVTDGPVLTSSHSLVLFFWQNHSEHSTRLIIQKKKNPQSNCCYCWYQVSMFTILLDLLANTLSPAWQRETQNGSVGHLWRALAQTGGLETYHQRKNMLHWSYQLPRSHLHLYHPLHSHPFLGTLRKLFPWASLSSSCCHHQ